MRGRTQQAPSLRPTAAAAPPLPLRLTFRIPAGGTKVRLKIAGGGGGAGPSQPPGGAGGGNGGRRRRKQVRCWLPRKSNASPPPEALAAPVVFSLPRDMPSASLAVTSQKWQEEDEDYEPGLEDEEGDVIVISDDEGLAGDDWVGGRVYIRARQRAWDCGPPRCKRCGCSGSRTGGAQPVAHSMLPLVRPAPGGPCSPPWFPAAAASAALLPSSPTPAPRHPLSYLQNQVDDGDEDDDFEIFDSEEEAEEEGAGPRRGASAPAARQRGPSRGAGAPGSKAGGAGKAAKPSKAPGKGTQRSGSGGRGRGRAKSAPAAAAVRWAAAPACSPMPATRRLLRGTLTAAACMAFRGPLGSGAFSPLAALRDVPAGGAAPPAHRVWGGRGPGGGVDLRGGRVKIA